MAQPPEVKQTTEQKPDNKGASAPPAAAPSRGGRGQPIPTVPGSKPAEPDKLFEGFLCEVVDVVKVRTGIYGEVKQAMCKVMEGKDKGRVIRRNVAGKITKGDYIRLPDTSREDKRIMAR